jgi:alpha-galactosidase
LHRWSRQPEPRAFAIGLAVATIRSIVGVSSLPVPDASTSQEFFGTAFWPGFTLHLMAAKAWIQLHPGACGDSAGHLAAQNPGVSCFNMKGCRVVFSSILLVSAGCSRPASKPTSQPNSAIVVNSSSGGPIVIKTSTAEFDILTGGYVQAYLVKGNTRLTLDEPQGDGASLISAGKPVRDLALDLAHAQITEAQGKLGVFGKRIVSKGRSTTASIEETLSVEVYDDFPNLAVTTLAFKNTGSHELPLDQVIAGRHRLNASLADPKASPYGLWSFQGSSYDWGKDEILPVSKTFERPNMMGGPPAKGQGGGIPVIDFWTGTVGEAFGHLETAPVVLSLPVKVEGDGRINASMVLESHAILKPGQIYSTPRNFVAVHTGDFYEPLHVWSAALQREGWTLPHSTQADYAVNWCGWGYEQDFTPAQMLGTIPKLKELGIRWATLDYRWFDDYGDWNPRADTLPGDSMKKIVDDFHRQGFLVQLWWQPIAVEDGHGKHALPKPMVEAKLVKEHPEWLILDQNGRHSPMISPVSTVAALCPALPEVQDYHRKLVEKFIRDWGFDGHKMDSVFSVPLCYNPAHHHRSPDESVRAMAEVYKVIFQTTRALKPESVIQICPCGTTPNMAWLPFEDQPVTADPVGGFQVRRRIKMYKALLGPQAAVYGDHVELSEMRPAGKDYIETGKDFASTVGTGGVIGTKFTWPDDPPRPHFRRVVLTPEKESIWKKWIGIYNAKRLSQGNFLDLYTTGYDVPEAYAIEKDGKMYYAFFAPLVSDQWRGTVELRGLQPGTYDVSDYDNGKDLGTVDAAAPKLSVAFTGHLLLEVSRR